MMRHLHLEHRFIKHFPEVLEPGVLYVSMEYGSAAHSCCCGCGEEVVTPFTPKGWKLTFDGETVSIWPSVGSWTLRCRSHYIIWNGQVLAALPRAVAPIMDELVDGRGDEDRAETVVSVGHPVSETTKCGTTSSKSFWSWCRRIWSRE